MRRLPTSAHPVLFASALLGCSGLLATSALAQQTDTQQSAEQSGQFVGAGDSSDSDKFDRYLAAEEAADLALEFDSWTITEAGLIEARIPIDHNVVTQRTGLNTAQSRLEDAVDDLDDAVADRMLAQQELEDLETLLQTFAINTFLNSADELDPHPAAQVYATRREAPLATVTQAAIAKVHAASLAHDEAVATENSAREDRLRLEAEVETRTLALARAGDLVEVYELAETERQDEIALRTEEALTMNEQPRLSTVRGIRVNVGLAEALEALLAAAAEDGITLSGWGHRPVDQQIVLRVAHCGDSGYAIFDLPAGECSPPTARPGHSEHELGLAIDFTENGSILNSSSPGFLWMKEHAAEFGLINLASEPWHWSTTGH